MFLYWSVSHNRKLRQCVVLEREKNKKKYHNVGTILKSNIKIVERGQMDTPNTQLHDCSSSWISTGTSIKSGSVKLVLWAQASCLSEMM